MKEIEEYWKLKEQIHQKKVAAMYQIQRKMNLYGFDTLPYEINTAIYPELNREKMVITVFFSKDEKKLDKLAEKIFKSLTDKQ
jgi:hypothetical protein